ncbi:MAG TPA: Rieske (2Fe-2S) protein [Mycobacteriales bacterium]|nr:Rieske (2Fe-2S) protein [Mycobacteriales bacterium]
MQPFDSVSRLEDLRAIDPVVRSVRSVVHRALKNQRVADLLHGTWLGHPLHPALVQVPIGAWLAASVLDVAVPGSGPASATLVGVGLAGAAPAAWAGWADWADLPDRPARVGLVHAGTNGLAVGLYAGSLAARLSGRRGRGKLLALAGLGTALGGGVLGGHLAFRQAAGANHAEYVARLMPTGWTRVARLDELADGKPVERMVGPVPIMLLRRHGSVHALANTCSHLAGPLHEGELSDDPEPCVSCPWHGSTFRLRDGAVLRGPATAPQPVLETRVQGGEVEVRLEIRG